MIAEYAGLFRDFPFPFAFSAGSAVRRFALLLRGAWKPAIDAVFSVAILC